MLEIKLKEEHKIERLTNKTFKFDERFRDGFYSANYFLKTTKIIQDFLPNNIVTMQFFQREDDVMVCGLDEVIALVHTFARRPEELEMLALNDGDMISKNEPVLKITGRYEDFGFLESAIDGLLARRSSVATNVYRTVKVANGKRILNMADRQDDPYTQIGDGYAAYVGGLRLFSTDAMGEWVGLKGLGTMPHALIQLCHGDIKKAAELYLKEYPENPVTALIDYNNAVVKDSVALVKHLGKKLKAVRVDTSKALIDHYFDSMTNLDFDPHGVNEALIFALRKALDEANGEHVEIIVSSGFNKDSIATFEAHHVPVDIYGVGTSFLRVGVGFTGDLVRLNGAIEAKEGRTDFPSTRLKKVTYSC